MLTRAYDFIYRKIPVLKGNKPLFIFVTRLLLIVVLLVLLKIIHKFLFDNTNIFGGFDIYQFLINSLIYPAQFILNLLGYKTMTGGATLTIVGYRGVVVHGVCLGTELMGAFTALVLAYPGFLNVKLWFLPLGILIIHGMNILRVAGITLVNKYAIVLPIEHHDLFNYIVYILIFIMFYLFVSNCPIDKVKAKN